MKKCYFTTYYRVYKNDTAITEISVNTLKPAIVQFKRVMPVGPPIDVLCTIPYFEYSLPPDDKMFYGYLSKALAMERAKRGAIAHINHLIATVELKIKELKQYREDHFDDLNTTLLDAHIRKIEKEINIK